MIFGLGLVKFGSGQTRVKFSSHFSVNFDLIQDGGAVHAKIIGKMVEQYMSNHNPVGKNYTLGCSGSQNYSLGRVGLAKKTSGWVLTRPIPSQCDTDRTSKTNPGISI